MSQASSPQLFVPLTGMEKPDFTRSAKSIYPFDTMTMDTPFCVGEDRKEVKQRAYAAICNRKKKHPGEQYRLHVSADGFVYVWKVAA